jgi:PAS domain S-box-containing protein
MSPAHSKSRDPNDVPSVGFWSIFEHSRIPMALVDRDRRYVSVNDAVVELYQYPRDEVLGRLAGRTSLDEEPATSDALWEQLVRSDELYGERVVRHANGTPMDVTYAAHATTVGGRWMALVVTLSARFLPDGPELLGPSEVGSRNDKRSRLTSREREVVRLVALGSSTRRIAADLGLSFETVRTHVRNAMAKTGAHTRAQLVALVLADGLIED